MDLLQKYICIIYQYSNLDETFETHTQNTHYEKNLLKKLRKNFSGSKFEDVLIKLYFENPKKESTDYIKKLQMNFLEKYSDYIHKNNFEIKLQECSKIVLRKDPKIQELIRTNNFNELYKLTKSQIIEDFPNLLNSGIVQEFWKRFHKAKYCSSKAHEYEALLISRFTHQQYLKSNKEKILEDLGKNVYYKVTEENSSFEIRQKAWKDFREERKDKVWLNILENLKEINKYVNPEFLLERFSHLKYTFERAKTFYNIDKLSLVNFINFWSIAKYETKFPYVWQIEAERKKKNICTKIGNEFMRYLDKKKLTFEDLD
jgi:hypothetical protein